jgi:tetratricopeptide (TPR) repeat protein
VPRDLETVILRATAKEPDRRYATAAELADDLRRFLADEPVRARRLGPWGHLARWCRRNPAVAALSGVAATLLVVGFVLVFWQWRRAERTLVEVAAQKQRAEGNFDWARTAVDELLSEVGEEMEDVPRLGAVRRRLLEKALALHQEFLRERSGDPAVRLEAARAHWRVGEIYRLLGPDRYAAAAESFTAALGLLEGPPTDPAEEAAYRLERGKALVQLGDLRRSQNDHTGAERYYLHAIEALEGTPADGDGPRLAAEARRLSAVVLERHGRFDEAEAAYRRARGELKALREANPAEPSRRSSLAHAHKSLGVFLRNRKRAGEAIDCQGDAVALLRGLAAEFPERRRYREDLGGSLYSFGNVLYDGDRIPDAAASYGEALALFERLAGDFPDVPAYRAHAARAHFALGLAHKRLNDLGKAEQHYRAAVAAWEGLIDRFGGAPEYRRELARGYNNLGNLRQAAGDPRGAEQGARDALAVYEGLARDFPDDPSCQSGLGVALGNLALRVIDRGEPAEAADLQRRALRHHRAAFAFNPDHPDYRRLLRTDCLHHARLLLTLNDHRGAAAAAREVAALSPGLGPAQSQAAQVLERCVELAESEAGRPTPERRRAARGYALEAARLKCRCAELAGTDTTLPEALRRRGVEAFRDSAVKLLRRAVGLGLDDPAALADPAFAPLRDRPDFDALLDKPTTRPKGGGR